MSNFPSSSCGTGPLTMTVTHAVGPGACPGIFNGSENQERLRSGLATHVRRGKPLATPAVEFNSLVASRQRSSEKGSSSVGTHNADNRGKISKLCGCLGSDLKEVV